MVSSLLKDFVNRIIEWRIKSKEKDSDHYEKLPEIGMPPWIKSDEELRAIEKNIKKEKNYDLCAIVNCLVCGYLFYFIKKDNDFLSGCTNDKCFSFNEKINHPKD